MATYPLPYLGYYVSTGTLTYSQPGSFIIDEGTTAYVQVSTPFLPENASTSAYFYDGARASYGVVLNNGAISFHLPLLPGGHAVTVLTPAAGSLARSAVLNLFQLPAPVGIGITADNTSSDFAPLLKGGYQMRFVNPANAIQLVDGVISTDTGGKEAIVARLYQGLLGRTYDAAGLGGYVVQLTNGASAAAVASQILAGTEYASAHGAPDDAQFVASLYAGFLGRVATPGESGAYQAQLAAGVDRGTVAAAFATSAEATAWLPLPDGVVFARDGIGTLVNQVYQTGLSRTVDLGGLATYKALLASGASAASFAAAIAGSAEFAGKHGLQSNQDYVTGLYYTGLGRAADAGGLADYTQRLNAGSLTRADVLLAVAGSAEATARLPTSL